MKKSTKILLALIAVNVILWLIFRKYSYRTTLANFDCPVTQYEIDHGCPVEIKGTNVVGLVPIINMILIAGSLIILLAQTLRKKLSH